MDYKSMLVSYVEKNGKEFLADYTIGVIEGIAGLGHIDLEEKFAEIVEMLKAYDEAGMDNPLPREIKIAPAPTEAQTKNIHPDCNMDTSKIEPLMNFPLIELGPDCKNCLCFKCKFLGDCHLELPSTVYHCHNECRGSAAKRICIYHVERCLA
ncbi:hypothetical protein [Desulfosporosinus sp. FKB]|uniref:hypothetical protein n=1 Tax=Desulfosporosinus sp. FKB TaxID=1969835 RepID=UPI000B49AAA5|nr:hypothetical protein [Desulfosporosinus sp. FKB]